MKFSKLIVTAMLLTALCFVVTVVAFNALGKTIQPELIVAFFAFIGVEGGAMAWIKNVDTKKGGGGNDGS